MRVRSIQQIQFIIVQNIIYVIENINGAQRV